MRILTKCLFTLLMAPLAFAQDRPATRSPTLEEIVVTGEKIDRSVQDTVSSVAVITADQIQDSALYDLQQVYSRMANVNSAFADQGFVIRGINYNSVSGGGNGGLGSLHIDGAVVSRRALSQGQSDLWDMQQIEVFRGPQSTNQGRNSLAGAVFLRSKDPTWRADGQYRAGYGEYNFWTASGAYGKAIIDDSLAFRVSLDRQESDGFVSNEINANDRAGKRESTTARGKLLFEPQHLQDLSILTTVSYSKNKTGLDFVSLTDDQSQPVDPFDREQYSNVLGSEDIKQVMGIVELRYDVTEQLNITSITSYNHSDFERLDDSDWKEIGGIATRTRDDESNILTQEMRVTFSTEKYQMNLGGYYFEEDRDEKLDDLVAEDVRSLILQFFPPPPGNEIAELYEDPFFLSRTGERKVKTDNKAVFGNIEYYLSDFVTVFAGFRYDREDNRNTANEERALRSDLPDPDQQPAAIAPLVRIVNDELDNIVNLEALDFDADYDAFLPKIGFTLNWTTDLSTSFTYQEAYRAGGAGTSGLGNYDYDPEFTKNYEVALRSLWLERSMSINANLFYVDWQDQQVQFVEPILQTDFIIANAGESTLYGGELELSFAPASNVTLFANVGYVESEFSKFPENERLGSANLEGNEFLASPNLTAATGISWHYSDNLIVQVDADYIDKTYANVENTFKNDNRFLVNSKITYQWSDTLELALAARNIFDEEYINLNGLAFSPVQWVGAPRLLALQVQGSF